MNPLRLVAWFGMAAACASLLACTPTERADRNAPIVLSYGTPYSPNHPFSRADATWMKFVHDRTNGRVRIQPYWGGALLSSDQSIVEIRHGVADVGLITPIYARGGAHLIRTQSGFYGGARTIPEQLAIYRCLESREPEFAAEMKGLVVLAVQGGSLPGIVTRDRPVRTLADLRGMRIRAPTELLSVLQELGADPVNMPMGEVYSAMAKGVLDGVIAPADTLRALHFAEIAKYFTTLEVPRGAYPARAMSATRWATLPEDVRAVLRDSEAAWEAALEHEIVHALQAGIDFGRKSGVTFVSVTPEEQRSFDALYDSEGLKNAKAATALGVDAETTFRRARALAAGLRATGEVRCDAVP